MEEVVNDPAVTLALPKQNTIDLRAAGYAHRVAIAKRFGQRISSKDAVFMSGVAAGMDMPRTVNNGQERPITGFNRWMLLQVMSDMGWKDSRFFTPKQIAASGWSLKQDAQPVVLQYVKTMDAKGLNLAIPEVQRFAVYNASLIEGVEPAAAVQKFTLKALTSAMVEAGFEPGIEAIEDLSQWVAVQNDRLGSPAGHYQLVQAMAVSAVLAHIEIDGRHHSQLQKLKGSWATEQWSTETQRLIEQDPAMFFDAVRVAEQLTGHIVSLTKLSALQLQSAQSKIKEQAEPDMQTLQAQAITSNTAIRSNTGLPAYQVRLEEMFTNRQAVLAVPYSEKDRAHELGAVYYSPQKLWFIPPGVDATKFAEWDPRKHHLGKTASNDVVIAEFEKELTLMGLELGTKSVIPDGQWHNVRVITKKGKNLSGAYLLNLAAETPIGQINNKHSGESRAWTYNGPLLTPEQRAKMRAQALMREEAANAERIKAQDIAAFNAKEILSKAEPAFGHAYVEKKGMNPAQLLQVSGSVLLAYKEFYGESGKTAINPNKNYLVLPMQTAAGELRAVQAIGEDGSKTFMRGGQKKGTMSVLGAETLQSICERIAQAPEQSFLTSFVEGFATGHSLHSATNEPVVICWDAGNLQTVVSEAAASMPRNMVPILAVDNDQFFAERALGFLSTQVGINPNSDRGSTIEIFSGRVSTRHVSMGDAIADGEWHQAPGGSYRMELIRESESTEVNEISMSVLPTGQDRAMSMKFRNGGVEAGIAAMKELKSKANPDILALMLRPEFRALYHRPTDWNDLHKLGGLQAVQSQFQDCISRAGLFKEPENQHHRANKHESPARRSGIER